MKLYVQKQVNLKVIFMIFTDGAVCPGTGKLEADLHDIYIRLISTPIHYHMVLKLSGLNEHLVDPTLGLQSHQLQENLTQRTAC